MDETKQSGTKSQLMKFIDDAVASFNTFDKVKIEADRPAEYPPSILSVDSLEAIMVSKMEMANRHHGKRILLHILPSDGRNPAMGLAEDDEGTLVFLHVINQPIRSIPSHQHRVCIVKEPLFRTLAGWCKCVRVDHISDIIWLDDISDYVPQKWKELLPQYGGIESEELRKLGNKIMDIPKPCKETWAHAEYLYSRAIKTAKTTREEVLARVSRARFYMKLGRPEKALNDAVKGCAWEDGLVSERAMYFEAEALYKMAKFGASLEKFLALSNKFPRGEMSVYTQNYLGRVQARLNEKIMGQYSLSDMYKQAKAAAPIIDCATFIGPVEVRPSTARGRGLFITKPVKADDLLLCEKAFACTWNEDSPDMAYYDLISQMVQKLYHNRGTSAAVMDLDHGDYKPVGVSEVDGRPIVDTYLVKRIIDLSNFERYRTSVYGGHPGLGRGRGVWPLASHIKSTSFGDTCHPSYIGDMLFVRATKDMQAGDELSIGYWAFCLMRPENHRN